MKKLVTAFAACVMAGMVSAEVSSQNIVGYQTMTAPGAYFSTGPTFISVGSATEQWKLSDVTLNGAVPGDDFVQFLDPATVATVIQATYIDAATAAAAEAPELEGWWDLSIENSLNDLTFAAGTGFICSFASAGVSITYAGEVLQGSTTLDLSGMAYPMVANFTPVDLTLGSITGIGMVPGDDFIQFLDPATVETIVQATYIDAATAAAAEAPELEGWWDLAIENSLNAQALPAGAAFIGSFASTGVMMTFPDPMP